MKINLIVPFKRLSGGIRVAFFYANDLTARGHDVMCYLPMVSYPGKGQSPLFRLKASVSNTFKPEHWFERKFPLKAVPKIAAPFIRPADVTIATAWQTAYDVAALPAQCGEKVYFVQDYEVFNGEAAEVDQSYRLGLHTITITRQLADFLRQRFSVDAAVCYNGLEASEFLSGGKPERGAPSVIMLCHESAHKGTQEGLVVIQQLKQVYPALQVNLFGRKRVEHLPPYATFLENPARTDLMALYRASDVYLFTSKIEAWGLPVLEAMANQCAVVGFRVGALAEIADGTNAVAVDGFDFARLKREAEALLGDAERLKEVQQAGYQTALRFRQERQCARFEALLCEFAGRRK